MARIAYAIAAVFLIAGTTAVVVGSTPETFGGNEEGSAATYHLSTRGQSLGNMTIARGADAVGLSPDGQLRDGRFYSAEWTMEGLLLASEQLHLAADGLWRHSVTPIKAYASVSVDGEFKEGVFRQFEKTRFEGASGLCGFILDSKASTHAEHGLPGCTSPFTVHKDEGWTLTGNGRTVVVQAGDVWPSKVTIHGEAEVIYERQLEGISETPAHEAEVVATPASTAHDARRPDDGGVTSWPMARALEASEQDLLYSDVRDFWSAHPQAGVVAAAFETRYENGERQESWTFVLSDGETSLGVHGVRATEQAPQGLQFLNPLFASVVETRFTSFAATGHYPTPGERPATLPDVQQTVAAWHVIRAHTDTPTSYALSMECMTTCASHVTVGRVQSEANRADAIVVCESCVNARMRDIDTLTVNQDGRFVALDQQRSTFQKGGSFETFEDDAFGFSSARLLVRPIGGVMTVVGLAALVGLLWKAAPLAGLFSRVHGDQALESPERRHILQMVTESPGVHHNQIVRASGKGNGAVEHHLRTLVRTGHLSRKRAGGFVCYYAKGVVSRQVMEALPSVKSALARQMLVAVRAEPGLTGAQLGRLTGADNSTIAYHLKRLETAGLIERRREGRAVQAYPEALAQQALRYA